MQCQQFTAGQNLTGNSPANHASQLAASSSHHVWLPAASPCGVQLLHVAGDGDSNNNQSLTATRSPKTETAGLSSRHERALPTDNQNAKVRSHHLITVQHPCSAALDQQQMEPGKLLVTASGGPALFGKSRQDYVYHSPSGQVTVTTGTAIYEAKRFPATT
ncbi:hypothetical protein HPP92_028750 [Vanilla planifolia]|uniref:Uncharacterized protein n=1 Tax=Vanilla planifolia TaxID=51239 RepID=A0A835P4S8_VANPL|nr:hypothetical protein HPP92_028750 [Vanilla planifolia]KAG0446661.1 hypothetical protein HPP92_028739 [Vanilla planifolia]